MDQSKESRGAKRPTRSAPGPNVVKPLGQVRRGSLLGGKTVTYKVTAYPYLQTGELLGTLASQRRREKETELYRTAADIGSLFVAIAGEAGEDGCYGTLTVTELAVRIRPYVVTALDWLAQNGSPLTLPGNSTLADGLLARMLAGMGTSQSSASTRTPASEDFTEIADVFLSDTQESALALEDGGGFL
jgi:hypothetical protein